LEFLAEALLEVRPRKFRVVQHVDYDVEGRFNVVTSRFVVASNRVQRSEQKVAVEGGKVLFLDVVSGWQQKALREPEID